MAFHGRELFGLDFGHDLRVVMPLNGEQEGERQREGDGNPHRALEKIDVVAAQEVPRGNAEHEKAAQHPGGENRMQVLAPRKGIRDDLKEARKFGPAIAQDVADGVLHPAVGEDDPQRREVGGNSDQPDGQQVDLLAHMVPAEDPDRQKDRFEEEGGGGFNGEERAENVAHVFRIARPVGAELEFERDPGHDAQREVDDEKLSPELHHPFVHFLARTHVKRLHDGEQDHQPEGQRDEDEVEKDGHGKLQP